MSKDIMTPSQRRLAMAHNRGRTHPERMLASALWRRGVRYFTPEGYKSVSGKKLLGNPDLIFPRKKLVIFVDGCFWHGCLQCGKSPKQSGEFWVKKIETNKKRDCRVTSDLTSQGWTVLRIPEHDLCRKPALDRTVEWLMRLIQSGLSGGGKSADGGGSVQSSGSGLHNAGEVGPFWT